MIIQFYGNLCIQDFLMFHINYQMEEKKAEIKNYLNSVVTPFLTPLMEEMAWKKPSNLAEFGYNYFGKILS